jgi:hypothetical protein
MPGLVPGIHALFHLAQKDVDGRDKPGHDTDNKKAGIAAGLSLSRSAKLTWL